MSPYAGRPGPSPVLAALFAVGELRAGDPILDVGCGDGTDCLAMARWGARVVGVDNDKEAIRVARQRATTLGLARSVDFRAADVLDLGDHFAPASFYACVDTLLLNNLPRKREPAYAREIARVVRPDGLWIIQWRATIADHKDKRGPPGPPRSFTKWFNFGPATETNIAEYYGRRAKPYARVVLWVGVRNRAPPK